MMKNTKIWYSKCHYLQVVQLRIWCINKSNKKMNWLDFQSWFMQNKQKHRWISSWEIFLLFRLFWPLIKYFLLTRSLHSSQIKDFTIDNLSPDINIAANFFIGGILKSIDMLPKLFKIWKEKVNCKLPNFPPNYVCFFLCSYSWNYSWKNFGSNLMICSKTYIPFAHLLVF